ncbi:MAG: ABC-type iron(III) uptake system ATPase component FbpC [Phormidesmis priestleyi Ana]|uniref:ABC-type quaternary amine transporter n=1 Tax=Phormidesmis priestleyi Ana TaxID=1666911 RepID=A0A0P8BUK5_9CYAN|nr:MAG: ABC-type iron(III) uptake system ATPase component FbpC [Phormidesmis priestleyi Ana]
MSLPTPVLSCRNITKRFGRAIAPAVAQVSFDLHKGDLLGLLGPSGCGKTTLLRLMAGFEIPDETGQIELAGRLVCGAGLWVPPEQRQVGIVFQDYALFPHLSVLQNVEFGLKQLYRRGKLAKKQIQELAHEALSLVGLESMKKRYPHELSGGQQQRVALARALAPRPPLILLDEPFSNLDVQVRLRLRQEVRDILKGVGASGVFVTHDQEEALAIADRVAVMHQGKIEQLDTPEGIYQSPASRFIAEFVTQANFVPAVRSAQGWKTELGLLEMRPDNSFASVADQGDLMISQEDLQIVRDENGTLIVQSRQFLGRVYQYSLLLKSGKVLEVRTAATQQLAVGDSVSVKINEKNVRLFPASTSPIAIEAREKLVV